ncbi:MAG: ribosome small subunit-dependent GTPase A [Firmicutes bacterium]|nr:ribosome small subunit-dependent GTPase A [Bacillota bacterium]
MKKGLLTKIISNQYTIFMDNAFYVASPRGKMRLQEKPCVGDVVEFEKFDDSYRIHSICERKNRLLRPAISNVDQALIVTSCKDPDFSVHLLNRLIILVSLAHVEPVICVTKSDIAPNIEEIEKTLDWYKKCGYTVVYTDPNRDTKELEDVLRNKISVLCGQSGAGKSSLLNRIEPSFTLQTQEISKALGRGKHTTRHCELHPICDGWVADTPGFSSLDFKRLDTTHLDEVIKDFQPYLNQCKFNDCIHINEPSCAIKEALEKGEINPYMYEDYKSIKEGLV